MNASENKYAEAVCLKSGEVEMISFFYNFAIGLGFLLFLPKIGWDQRKKQKRFPSWKDRWGSDVPDPEGKTVFWVHAVSVGEVKSAKPLVEIIRTEHPEAFILVTMASVTGQEEAKRFLKEADAFRFLPLDFSWIMRRWTDCLQPKALLLIEGDLWYHLTKHVARVQGKIVLVSGKISLRSARRYQSVAFFSKKLFSLFDLILLQNEEYLKRFQSFVEDEKKLFVTGNLKFDGVPVQIDRSLYEKILSPGIMIACTHAPEEEELLDALQGIDLPIFLAPRHPERFQEVALLLTKKRIDFVRWSEKEKRRGGERVILIDGMGLLPIFYSFSQLAIVAGSFSSRIGGHNILEPCLYGVPVFFGPHMHQQQELAESLLLCRAGVQVSTSELAVAVQTFLAQPVSQRLAVKKLLQTTQSPLKKTWEKLQFFLR
jgi:3-deoxy-D-manno-octulosonic-acid transferase